jgi:hypothetical protein
VADENKGLIVAQNLTNLLKAGVCGSKINFAHGVEPQRGVRILPGNPVRARINLRVDFKQVMPAPSGSVPQNS